ncbi:alpha-mannosidase [Paenibacillus sp. WLX2291]|uniref:alpha-mannosidase n=1 Tax=Paenibacillus sp. WLX2291 TaxID=3296934 RepID=UPI003983FB31
MFFTEDKLRKRLEQLEPLRYRELFVVPSYTAIEDREGINGAYPPLPESQEHSAAYTLHKGEHWTGRDRYIWLSATIAIPAEWQDRTVIGLFDFGTTEGGNNGGFESLAYLNGKPFQGVDSNHIELILPVGYTGEARFDFRLWSGLEGGGAPRELTHTIRDSRIGWLDHAADRLYYTSLAILQTIAILPESAYERSALLKLLNDTYRGLDWSVAGSADFYASVETADASLNAQLETLKKEHPVLVTAVGHTHIDVAWLWRLKHTREKAARSFSTVLRLMEHDPEYIFLQTQPQLYEYIKQDYPELYERIKERIAEGRWEAGGGMWVEADCNLTSGESLVRQFLLGTRFFKEEFGVESSYLWLPDVFGYSWALPQILRKSGFDTFMTTKISWNQVNRMPRDTFRWRGIDGSEVLTHFITTPDDWEGGNSFYYTYNGLVEAQTVQGVWNSYQDKEANQNLLISYGYGDGGGGVTREMLELRRQLNRIPGVPVVRSGRADDYFNKLQQTFHETDSYVHTWDGELYLEYHRGTYTSQAYNKKLNRKLELLYREAEWLQTLNIAHSGDWSSYPAQNLQAGWKIILRNQFHDIIPGSSIAEVYEDSTAEYAEAEQIGRQVWREAAGAELPLAPLSPSLLLAGEYAANETDVIGVEDQTIAVDASTANQTSSTSPLYSEPERDNGTLLVLNSSSWALKPLVHIPYDQCAQGDYVWSDSEGQPLAAQHTTDGWIVQSSTIPSLGTTMIHYAKQQVQLATTDTTPAVQAQYAERMTGATNENNTTDESQLPFVHTASVTDEDSIFTYEHGVLRTPHYELTWNAQGQLISITDLDYDREVLTPGERGNVLQLFEDKPMNFDAWDIDIFYQEKMQEIADLQQVQLLEQGALRAVVQFVWHYNDTIITQQLIVYRHDRRIDFVTHVDWKERQKLLKVAFPVQIRSTEATYDIQFGNVKRPTHWNTSWDWARFESVGHQWADLSERNYGVSLLNDCKYGYDIKDHVIRLSLLKSAIYPDPMADYGQHQFTYSLYPHGGDWLDGGTVQAAWQLNQPVTTIPVAASADAANFSAATHDTLSYQAQTVSSSAGTSSDWSSFSMFSFSAEHVMVDAVKKAEDSNQIVLRIHEYGGIRTPLTITSDLDIASWQECNLMEQPAGDSQQGELHITITPYELRTFLISLREE